jgi:dihydrofolate synthase / folylpolyglutamate synthase
VPDPFVYLSRLEQFGVKLGLESITAIVEALGRPDRSFTSVHVAGTNGKGSVTAMVDAALRAAGHRSARYTSPHLVRLAERFAIDGAPVSDADLAETVDRLRVLIEDLMARGRLDVHPTFFEATTAAAFELFRRAEVDVAVFEVGLGGRLDATNVLEPAVTAITSIGLDHQQHLGSTLQEIAAEKAGIAKPGVPLVTGVLESSAAAAIARIAAERGASIVAAADGTTVEPVAASSTGSRFRLRTPRRDYGEVELALAGEYQVGNALVAVRVLEELDSRRVEVSEAAVRRGLAEVRWPGRLDLRRLPDGREVLLDAAHNQDGARALAAYLHGRRWGRIPLVFAAMRDKDAAAMLGALAPAISVAILTRASHPRSSEPSALQAVARAVAPELNTSVEARPFDALHAAWRAGPRIVVAGSIFLLGDVIPLLGS